MTVCQAQTGQHVHRAAKLMWRPQHVHVAGPKGPVAWHRNNPLQRTTTLVVATTSLQLNLAKPTLRMLLMRLPSDMRTT